MLFEFSISQFLNLDEKIAKARNVAKSNGFITYYEMREIFDWSGCSPIYDIDKIPKIGWTYDDISGNVFHVIDHPVLNNYKSVKMPQPNLISALVFNPVSNPSHYTEGRKYEPRKVIADWGLNFNLGNAVKYIARAGRKGNKAEDLKKAIQYIEFEMEELEETKNE